MKNITISIDPQAIIDNIDCEEIASHIDCSEVASNFDCSEIAANLDYSEIAANIDYSDLVSQMDDDVAEKIMDSDYRFSRIIKALAAEILKDDESLKAFVETLAVRMINSPAVVEAIAARLVAPAPAAAPAAAPAVSEELVKATTASVLYRLSSAAQHLANGLTYGTSEPMPPASGAFKPGPSWLTGESIIGGDS